MNDVSPRYLDGFRAARGVRAGPAHAVPPPPGAHGAEDLPFEERVKRALHPLDAFPRLLDAVRNNRPPDAEDRFRFQWFGLFYQGPEQDAFALRVRLPGGRLSASQLAALAGITQELAGGCLVGNARGGMDIPSVAVRDAAELLRRVEETGLRALLTGGDCVQAVRGGGHDAGPAAVYPLVRALEQALALNRRLADLPQPCEVVFCDAGDLAGEEGRPDTVLFQATPGADGAAEFALAVPGSGLPELPLTAARTVPACLALLHAWAERAPRADRHRAGLAEFCAGLGEAGWRDLLTRAAGPPAAGVLEVPLAPAAVGVAVPDGRLLSGQLARLADVARDHGAGEVCLASARLSIAPAGDRHAAESALRDALRPL